MRDVELPHVVLKKSLYSQLFFLCCLTVSLTGCSWLFPKKETEIVRAKDLGFPEVPYKTVFVFKEPFLFEKDIKESSKLLKLEEQPPTSHKALYYRCKADHKEIKNTLDSYGFFDAKISFRIYKKGAPPDLEKQSKIDDGAMSLESEKMTQKESIDGDTPKKEKPAFVRVSITPGPRYTVKKVIYALEGDSHGVNVSDAKLDRVLKILKGSPVDMDKIVLSMGHLRVYCQNHGFPYAIVDSPKGELHRETHEMTILVSLQLKAYQVFGEVDYPAVDFISQKFLENRLSWTRGQIYDQREVTKTRQKLLEKGIFSSVIIEPQEKNAEAGGDEARLTLKVEKAPPRTIGFGIRYATTDGLGGKAYWSHRNFFGGGEVLDANINISKRESFLKLLYEQPDILRPDLLLVARLVGRYERSKAYKGPSSTAYLGFTYDSDDYLSYSIGGEAEYSHLRRREEKAKSTRIFSVPFSMNYDTVNNPLDPIKGVKLTINVAQNVVKSQQYKSFTKIEFMLSSYVRLNKNKDFVLALWSKVGSIPVETVQTIPLNKRFYGGGAGSVRGYGFQKLSPLDADGLPFGGNSLLEFGIEPRFKITEKIGAVTFVEAGRAETGFKKSFFQDPLLVGIGAGVRYYTEIGPIRFDVALPLRKRRVNGRKIDASAQFYISFGQAF